MTGQEASSSLKGKIAATLIGIACAQDPRRQINFASPFVDDEGVDLIFFKRGGSAEAILAQVKSRTTESKQIQKGVFIANVKRSSFRARKGYYFIFATLDRSQNRLLNPLWFIPSVDFKRKTSKQNKLKVLTFQSRFDSRGMWKNYRISLEELPERITQVLGGARKR